MTLEVQTDMTGLLITCSMYKHAQVSKLLHVIKSEKHCYENLGTARIYLLLTNKVDVLKKKEKLTLAFPSMDCLL